jgi:hypothetical protein
MKFNQVLKFIHHLQVFTSILSLIWISWVAWEVLLVQCGYIGIFISEV